MPATARRDARSRMSSSSSDGSNAAESDDDEFFATVLDELPPVHGAFAYGSAVFGQRGYTVLNGVGDG